MWFVRANRMKEKNSFIRNELPDIELVITATEKDFSKLEKSLRFAIQNSINKIKIINIVVPASDFFICEKLITNMDLRSKYKLINEENLFNQSTRNLISKNCLSRYGWVIQQLIKIKLAYESNFRGVLIIDSDTMLLGKNIWLDANGVQNLIVANSKHQPYINYLKKLGVVERTPKFSFVTHHMLMQPEIIKSFFSRNGYINVEDFIIKVFERKEFKSIEELSLDYELYGQYIFFQYKERYILNRFCNLSLISSIENIKSLDSNAYRQSKEYNSISFHSWNQI
jgi:hypothetical protein